MAIIKYRVEARTHHTNVKDSVIGSSWVWEDVGSMVRPGRVMSREEALAKIKAESMILVHKTPFGAVYDKPEEPFLERHQGWFGKKIKQSDGKE